MQMIKKRLAVLTAGVLLLLLPFAAQGAPGDENAAPQPAPYTALTQKQLSPHTFRHVFANTVEYFELPALHTVAQAQLTLDFSVTPLAEATLSTLTLTLNGTPFDSFLLSPGPAPQQLTVQLPARLLQRGFNALGIDGYIRMHPDFPCTDEVNPAGWMQLYDTSTLSISYAPDAPSGLISEFPYPFAPQLGRQTLVAVSDKADNNELAAALKVVALLSRSQAKAPIISYRDIPEEAEQNIILISLAENAPPQADIPAPAQGTANLTRSQDAQGRQWLTVLGSTPQALQRAVDVLEDDNLIRQAGTTQLSIAQDQPLSPVKALANDGVHTLAQLGYPDGITLTGPFRQSASIPISLPRSRRIGTGARITLNMRYAKNLDFRRSLLTLMVDGIPIGSHKLSDQSAQGDTLDLFIPAVIDLPPAFTLEIIFDLEIEDLWCTRRPFDMPWAYIQPDSTLLLPTVAHANRSFTHYPAPFVTDGQLDSVLFVLPDDASAADFAGMAGIITQMGQSITRPGGSITVLRASGFDPSQADYNVILIGEPWRTPLIWQLNQDKLYFKFDSSYAIAPNEKTALLAEQAASLATLQLLPSPYAPDRAVLVASATRSEYMPLAFEYLSRQQQLWRLSGDGILIGEDGQLWDYQFAPPQQPRPAFEALTAFAPREGIWVLLGGGLLIILLFTLLMLWRRRQRRTLPPEGGTDAKA